MSSPGIPASTSVPVVMTSDGPQPVSPAQLLTQLLTLVSSVSQGYTANLPGSLIEDISSTDVGALSIADAARVDTINSLTPYGANAFLLTQLGNIYGVPIGTGSNTSVYVVFTGTPGFPIPPGFIVSDGTYQYTVQDGGIVASGGQTLPLFCAATTTGTWAVAAGTVTSIVTSVPSGVTLTCVNPQPGTPGAAAQTEGQYRAAVLQAGLASSQGTARYLKTLLGNVPGVQQNLIAVRQSGEGYEIIVGGGDPYQVAYAIFQGMFWLPGLVGSSTNITGITNANPGVVTTDINHGLTTGQSDVDIADVVGMTGVNGGPYTVTVISETEFSFGVNTTSSGTYTSGGVVTPNTRNQTISIDDYPDTYEVTFVVPPQQTVTMTVTWNTTSQNYVSNAAIAQLCQQPLVDYINAIQVGSPINVLTLDQVFRNAVSTALTPELVTRLIFTVSINGVPTSPVSGEQTIVGDPESYFFATVAGITVIQG